MADFFGEDGAGEAPADGGFDAFGGDQLFQADASPAPPDEVPSFLDAPEGGAPAHASFDGFDSAPMGDAAPAHSSFDGFDGGSAGDMLGDDKPLSGDEAAAGGDASGGEADLFGGEPASPAAQPDEAPAAVVPAEPENPFRSQFEAQHAQMLEEKAAAEQERYERMLAKAREDLEEFYVERKKRTEAARRENREASAGVMDDPPKDDKGAWQNIQRLIDTQSTKKEGKDMSRMKEVLVAMRH